MCYLRDSCLNHLSHHLIVFFFPVMGSNYISSPQSIKRRRAALSLRLIDEIVYTLAMPMRLHFLLKLTPFFFKSSKKKKGRDRVWYFRILLRIGKKKDSKEKRFLLRSHVLS